MEVIEVLKVMKGGKSSREVVRGPGVLSLGRIKDGREPLSKGP